ncbi:hypothetical protein K431DRAFT_293096 [Polychaeton citri CBS 116435]|uniref:Uncharacterized protein n=1 Tax=Polychaeton citri CBS 116435 TaxID=1314669 RepID=A0A9P4QDM6_9PEZI|nr:hypothetical protein K431DRAFT_293096 [Polychaeton citri CBS 116435]
MSSPYRMHHRNVCEHYFGLVEGCGKRNPGSFAISRPGLAPICPGKALGATARTNLLFAEVKHALALQVCSCKSNDYSRIVKDCGRTAKVRRLSVDKSGHISTMAPDETAETLPGSDGVGVGVGYRRSAETSLSDSCMGYPSRDLSTLVALLCCMLG